MNNSIRVSMHRTVMTIIIVVEHNLIRVMFYESIARNLSMMHVDHIEI